MDGGTSFLLLSVDKTRKQCAAEKSPFDIVQNAALRHGTSEVCLTGVSDRSAVARDDSGAETAQVFETSIGDARPRKVEYRERRKTCEVNQARVCDLGKREVELREQRQTR